ncbi:uncharacterized protein EV422DRAFT_500983 [Fimicolochytrium jonesii]|uniref:uncharacterized protein n=1 Tax=Fimicolochytrium jonesii TaxID=1396493 RepID=UPI0022FEF4D6|nr:uncharacterized protein EV422DRAFT_500983 [Fimicolochytrium jonesii]KAI8816747.1 hypothetical protein EV422DRAFT_500983 [Fimicolochytrium jonesii]
MANRFSEMLKQLKQKGDPTMQLVALQELSEILVMATGHGGQRMAGFDTNEFVKALVDVLRGGDGGGNNFEEDIPLEMLQEMGMSAAELGFGGGGGMANPELILLACRCLSNLIEAHPSSTGHVLQHGAVDVLVGKLMEVEYIDLAEQVLAVLNKISVDYPSAIVRANGLLAVLQYIDFFGLHVQRTAVTIAANACQGLGSDADPSDDVFNKVKDVVPILERLLSYADSKLVEQTVRALDRIIEWCWKSEEKLEAIVTPSLLQSIITIITPSGTTSANGGLPAITPVFTKLTKVLVNIAKGSPKFGTALLVEYGLIDLIQNFMTGGVSTGDVQQDRSLATETVSASITMVVVSRPADQVLEVLRLASAVLPTLPAEGLWDIRSLPDAAPGSPKKAGLFARPRSKSPEKSPTVSDPMDVDHSDDAGSASRMSIDSASTDHSKTGAASSASHLFTDVSERRLKLLGANPDAMRKYVTVLLPTFIEVFGVTVNPNTRRAAVECVAKGIWYTDDPNHLGDTLGDNQMFGKFVPELLSLRQIVFEKDTPEKERLEAMVLVASGLQIASTVIDRCGERFKSRFTREGAMEEIAKIVKLGQQAKTDPQPESPTKVASSSHLPAPVGRRLSDLVRDLKRLRDQVAGHMGGSPASNITTGTSGNTTTLLNGVTYTEDEIRTWIFATAQRLLEKSTSSSSANQSGAVLGDLRRLGAVLDERESQKGELAICEALQGVARHFVGEAESDGGVGITSFELLESGIMRSFADFLSKPSSEDLVAPDPDVAQHTTPIGTRLKAFLHVFMNGPSPDHENRNFYVAGAFKALLQRLQECLSRVEQFDVATAVSSATTNYASTFTNNPSLQLTRQLKIKLVAAEPDTVPKPYQALMISVHAVATYKALEDYLKGRIVLPPGTEVRSENKQALAAEVKTASEDAPAGEAASDAEKSAESDQILTPYLQMLDVSDLLLKAEETTRQRRRGSSITASAAAADAADPSDTGEPDTAASRRRDSVVDVRTDSPMRRPSTAGASSSRRESAALPESSSAVKSYASAVASSTIFNIEFRIDNTVIPHETTIFGSVFAAEQRKGVKQPNVWNQAFTMVYRKVWRDESAASATEAKAKAGASSKNTAAEKAKDVKLHRVAVTSRTGAPVSVDILPPAAFANTKLTAKLNRQLDEPLIVASDVLPKWCASLAKEFSFLVPFETRLAYMQSTSFGYSRSIGRWQHQQNGRGGGSGGGRGGDGGQQLGRLQRQKVRIARQRLLDSTMKVMELYGSTQALLEVEFFDEVGTGLGPTLEFYSNVCREARRSGGVSVGGGSNFKVWRDDNGKAEDTDSKEEPDMEDLVDGEYLNPALGLFPAPMLENEGNAETNQRILTFFTGLGTFVAKALLDSRLVDLPFNPIFLEMVVGEEEEEEQAAEAALGKAGRTGAEFHLLRHVDPSLYKSLLDLKKYVHIKRSIESNTKLSKAERVERLADITVRGARLEDLCLDFTLPGYPTYELIENGAQVAVSIDNVEKYIDSVVEQTVGTGVARQVEAFRTGFDKVFPAADLRSFTVQELSVLVGGAGSTEEDWEYDSLMESIKADHGYTKESATIRNLVSYISVLTPLQRREFLQFVTGSPKLPIGGFKALMPPLTVVRKTVEQSGRTPDDYLPSVMTCVNYLKVPDYSDAAVMKKRFEVAVREGQGCFHLS